MSDYVPDAALVDALKALDAERHRIIKALIVAELESWRPEYEEREEDAAAALRDAVAALDPGERAFAALDAGLAYAKQKVSEWETELTSENADAHVAGRVWVSEWRAEVASLEGKRLLLLEDLAPLQNNRETAKAVAARAATEREALELNANPEHAYVLLGCDTNAYRGLRWGADLTWILADEDDPEHDEAKAHLSRLTAITGREVAEKTIDEWTAEARTTLPSPQGADVLRDERRRIEAQLADRTHVEDRRGWRFRNTSLSHELRERIRDRQ